MFVQILPWLIVVALVGLTLGLVLGMCLASKLVGGHSLHIQRLNHSQGLNSVPLRASRTATLYDEDPR